MGGSRGPRADWRWLGDSGSARAEGQGPLKREREGREQEATEGEGQAREPQGAELVTPGHGLFGWRITSG